MKSDRSRLAVCRSDRADRRGLFASCFAVRDGPTVADAILDRIIHYAYGIGSLRPFTLVIACYARKETRIAWTSIEQIANEVNLDRRNVQGAIRRLEAKGVLKRLRGDGRLPMSHAGHCSEYKISFEPPAGATNSVDDAVSDVIGVGSRGAFCSIGRVLETWVSKRPKPDPSRRNSSGSRQAFTAGEQPFPKRAARRDEGAR